MTYVITGRCLDKSSKRTVEWSYSLKQLAVGEKILPFRGRPELTLQIREAFEQLYCRGTKSSAIKHRNNLAHFWRFLDHLEQLSQVLSPTNSVIIDRLEWEEIEALWPQFIDWTRAQNHRNPRWRYLLNYTVYTVLLRAFENAVERLQTTKSVLNIYIHFRDKQTTQYNVEHVELEAAKRGFRQLAGLWRRILKRIEYARALAAEAGGYATGSSGANRWNGGVWTRVENRLAAVMRELPFAGLDREHSTKKFRDRLLARLPDELIIPELGQGESGLIAHTACLFLRPEEIAVALAMVTMKSGMNVDAITRMTVDAWYRPDPILPEKRVIIFGPKRVGAKNIRASSSVAKLTDPYQIIRKVIDIQAPLRERMREIAGERGDRRMKERADLIWIAPTLRSMSSPAPQEQGVQESAKILGRLFTQLAEKDGLPPFKYSFSDGRDIWGLFVYHKSGFNHLLTAQALGQSTLRSLLHYLEKRVVIIEDRKRLIDLQGKVMGQLKAGHYLPQNFRLPMDRASTGLLCADKMNPDPDADPGNAGDRTCGAQRCFACSKWFATSESLPFLSRILLDLAELRDRLALALWEASDFPIMFAIYEHIRGKFHQSFVDRSIEQARQMPPIISTGMFVGQHRRLPA